MRVVMRMPATTAGLFGIFCIFLRQRIDERFFQHGGKWQAHDDEAHRHRHEKSEQQTRAGHHPSALTLEGLPGAQRGDRIHDRSCEHVGERAGNRQAFADQAPDHRYHRTFANRKDRAQQTCHHHRPLAVARQETIHRARRQIDIDEATDQRAEKNERRAFEKDAQKRECKVLLGIRRHRSKK